MDGDAVFDPTGTYRYTLWRAWAETGMRVAFVMLNPSTADTGRLDPTVRRCLGYAQRWGYASLEVVNLFAYRTPSPTHLRTVRSPVGPDNDAYVLAAVERADAVLLGWGNWGSLHGRDREMLRILRDHPLHCLGWTNVGQPRHPLYLRLDERPVLYDTWRESSQGARHVIPGSTGVIGCSCRTCG